MSIREINFSLWCDFIERDFLEHRFKELIELNMINGATSNPTIFANAFLKSSAYKDQIISLKDKNPKEIYENLAFSDIKRAAELLFKLYSLNNDGFISIEIDPFLCDDVKESLKEAIRIIDNIKMQNLMIKVPATEAGFEVIEELIAFGINVNVTLIFSQKQVQKSLIALEKGFNKAKKHIPHAVLSIFVSRFDRLCDSTLEKKGFKKGQLGIMNATMAYHKINKASLPNTKTLFASTGVKGDEYPQTYYIDELLFKNSINTAPLNTIEAYIKDSKKITKEPTSLEEIEEYFKLLVKNGINLDQIYTQLLDEGIKQFKSSFSELLNSLKG